MVVLESLEHLFYLPTDFALVPNQGYNGWAFNSGRTRLLLPASLPLTLSSDHSNPCTTAWQHLRSAFIVLT